MSGKKGMKHYPKEFIEQVRQEYENGTSMCSLERKYGISRYSIASWCGKRLALNHRHAAPLKRGRPSAERTIEDYKQANNRYFWYRGYYMDTGRAASAEASEGGAGVGHSECE